MNGKRGLLIVIILVAAAVSVQMIANTVAESKVRKFASRLPYTVTWSKVRFNVIRQQTEISDLSVGSAKAELITVSRTFKMPSVPSANNISINNFSIPVTKEFFGKYHIPLSLMGYNNFTGSAKVVRLRQQKERAGFSITMKVENFGNINSIIIFGGVKAPDALISTAKDKPLMIAWLTFYDEGLIKELTSFIAKTANIPQDKAKERLLNGLNNYMHTQFKTEGAERDILKKLYRFIDSAGELTVEIKEQNEPVTLNDLRPPDNISGWRSTLAWLVKLPVTIE